MSRRVLYLSQADVEAVDLPMAEVIEWVAEALRQKGLGRTEMPPKPGIHTQPDSFIHAMPAFIPSMGSAGMKWVSGYPGNQARGLPYISGLLILNDPETGIPLMISDCAWVTAMRTAAASAVAARVLARKDSRSMAMLGCGVQGRTNLTAIKEVFPELSTLWAFDTSPVAAEDYRAFVEERHPDIELRRAGSAEEAVKNADIVISAGPILKHPHPVIRDEWFQRGAFACPLDFDSYWTSEAMKGSDLFFTDDVEQLRYYQTQGYFLGAPEATADLGALLAGKAVGRTAPGQRIISMNLGIALEDMAVAIHLFERARERGLGVSLPL